MPEETEKKFKIRDIAERTLWTVVAAAIAAVPAAAILDIEAWKAAASAAFTALTTAILVIARWRLKVLPDPGQAVAEHAAGEVIEQINELGK